MATFSENQVSHLYVANSAVEYVKGTTNHIASTDAAGAVMVRPDGIGENFYFECKNALGEVLRSDIINKKNILWCGVTAATKMARKLAVKTITIPTPAVGEEFYVRVDFRQYAGQSDADTYVQWANFVATTTTAADVASGLAALLKASLAKDPQPVVEVSVSGAVITLTEVEQPWVKGMMESVPVYFEAYLQKVGTGNTVTDLTSTAVASATGATIGNGKKIADLEYFLLGERGDQYRVMDPFGVKTEGLVDYTKTYDVINIHYYADECNTNNAKSEKDIMIACPTDSSNAVVKALAGYINTVAGTSLPTTL